MRGLAASGRKLLTKVKTPSDRGRLPLLASREGRSPNLVLPADESSFPRREQNQVTSHRQRSFEAGGFAEGFLTACIGRARTVRRLVATTCSTSRPTNRPTSRSAPSTAWKTSARNRCGSSRCGLGATWARTASSVSMIGRCEKGRGDGEEVDSAPNSSTVFSARRV